MKPIRRTVRRFGTIAALACFIAVVHPGHIDAQATDLVAQGRQVLAADKVDEALAIFEKAVTTDPQNPASLAWLGSAQVRKARTVPPFEGAGWVKRGFNTLDEAVERFPNAFIAYMVRGITATQVPDLFKKAPVAVKDLSAVVAMREKNAKAVPDAVMPSVYLNLGLAYKKNGQPAEARAAWEKGKQLYPSAPETPTIEKELRSL